MFGREAEKVELIDVLNNRDARVELMQEMLQQHPNATLVTMQCNIPGPVKTSREVEAFFTRHVENFFKEAPCFNVINKKVFYHITGPEAFVLLNESPEEIKKYTVLCENKTGGRLLDIDVSYWSENTICTIKRGEIGVPRRQCLCCDEDAKVCGRARKHSVEELQEKILHLLQEELIESKRKETIDNEKKAN